MHFLIFISGLVAGFVDAIAGGGGLIMIPALLLSGLPPQVAIATNKLCSSPGAVGSSIRFAQDKHVDWSACLWMGIPAIIGSLIGSRSIGYLPKEWAEPVVIFLLFGITLFILFRPQFGMHEGDRAGVQAVSLNKKLRIGLFGAVIGFHDGFFGPGTGTFFVFVLLSLAGLNFVRGTGTAKVLNLATNLTALGTFLIGGAIHFPIGIAGGLGYILGSYAGASFAVKKGARIIRPLFLIVASLMIGKLLMGHFLR